MAQQRQGRGQQFIDAFLEETGWDNTDWLKARFLGLEMSNRDIDEVAIASKVNRIPAVVRTRSALSKKGNFDEALQRLGMENKKEGSARLGQMLGTAASEIRDDGARGLWWLINAVPATSHLLAESLLRGTHNKALNKTNPIVDPKTNNQINIRNESGKKRAVELGYATGRIQEDGSVQQFHLKADTQSTGGKLSTRQYKGGHIKALTIPQAIAINTGLGLMTPFGGAPGYEAALPSQSDPSQTENVIGEVAAKYFLSRTGNLLPYEEFKKVRPDVSKDEYYAYKAFKYDKNADLDLSDGDMTLPMGVLKYTNEGIHGPEVQFLGKSLPATTGILPYASTVAGGLIGGMRRVPGHNTHLVRNMFLGGMGGLSVGLAGGNLLEAERQRRNMRENEQKTVPLDPESTAIGF